MSAELGSGILVGLAVLAFLFRDKFLLKNTKLVTCPRCGMLNTLPGATYSDGSCSNCKKPYPGNVSI